jgi:hypothetical protein
MLDGSVIVSGSDPQDPRFPQEYRHERFSPPYLLNGQIRPGFTLPVKDWAYKGGYQIILKGTASVNMKIVLIGGKPPYYSRIRGKKARLIWNVIKLRRAHMATPCPAAPSCQR